MPSDSISISGLTVDCIVGLNPEERLREQPLILDIELGLDLRQAGRNARFSATCDYDRVSLEVAALLRFRRYWLIEVAVEELAAMLLGVHPQLDSVRICLNKPRALEGRAKSAGVQIFRRPRDYAMRHEAAKFGEVDILLETKNAGLYLLHVDPGRAIPPHHHECMRELEWLVEGSLLRNGRAMTGFEPVEWPKAQVHGYENKSDQRATLFCCDLPPFIPSDEIEEVTGR